MDRIGGVHRLLQPLSPAKEESITATPSPCDAVHVNDGEKSAVTAGEPRQAQQQSILLQQQRHQQPQQNEEKVQDAAGTPFSTGTPAVAAGSPDGGVLGASEGLLAVATSGSDGTDPTAAAPSPASLPLLSMEELRFLLHDGKARGALGSGGGTPRKQRLSGAGKGAPGASTRTPPSLSWTP